LVRFRGEAIFYGRSMQTVRVTAAVEPELLHALGRPDERLLRLLGETLIGGVLAILVVKGTETLRRSER
jgi:hypothetical protein